MTHTGHRPMTKAIQHRLKRKRAQSLLPGQEPLPNLAETKSDPASQVDLDCGWGHLLFGQTFDSPEALIDLLLNEEPDRRDIAFYIRDPHVLLTLAPQDIFLDPSHTFRLNLATYHPKSDPPKGFQVRRLCSENDAHAVNRIYAACGMVGVEPDFFWQQRDNRTFTYLVAEDTQTGDIIGSITGIDHERAFADPEHGASLWCLAVDQRASHAKVGEALVRHLAGQMAARGCSYIDLSVIHDNESAIRLYERMGFERIPFFTLKRKNPINEKLFTRQPLDTGLNPYARIIVDEARRRGISVDVLDADGGFFRLTHGGRSIVCRESLTELTSAVAMSRCDDKQVTRRLMREIGLPIPEGVNARDENAALDLLHRVGSVVVKPSRGEQGRGVFVDLQTEEALKTAIKAARDHCPDVLIETFMPGDDMRVIVIQGQVVAAAIRKRPTIMGNGEKSIRALIEGLSRRRAAATDGEAHIPLDGETARCVRAGGYDLDDVLPAGESLEVRRTANLHTGGTLHDVTADLHEDIVKASLAASEALGMPVVGLDFIVKAPDDNQFIFIEANERPGLANHEPQPVVERFIDLLFPQTLRLDAPQGGLVHDQPSA